MKTVIINLFATFTATCTAILGAVLVNRIPAVCIEVTSIGGVVANPVAFFVFTFLSSFIVFYENGETFFVLHFHGFGVTKSTFNPRTLW